MSEGTGPEAVPSWLGERPKLGTPEHREWAWKALRAVFPPEQVGVLPKPTSKDGRKGPCDECGGFHMHPAVHLPYVGHAAVTDRLLAVDPEWNWEPVAFGDDGLPKLVYAGQQPVGLWIRLTVAGVTRIGHGSVEPGVGEAVKQLVSDALRNAALRFGVALDMWSKEDLLVDRVRRGEALLPPGVDPEDGVPVPDSAKTKRRRRTQQPDQKAAPLEESLRRVDALARSKGMPREDFTARWRTANGKPIEDASPVEAAAFVDGAIRYMREQGEFVPEDAL